MHGRDAGRVLRCEIVLLADISREVEKRDLVFIVAFDQQPVAVAHGSTGSPPLVRIVGEMPVDRPLRVRSAFQSRRETYSIQTFRDGVAGEVQKRRYPVEHGRSHARGDPVPRQYATCR